MSTLLAPSDPIPTAPLANAGRLTSLPAHELAALIARGEASSAEVVEAHIQRIEQVNPRLNAVVVKRYDQARAEARAADACRDSGQPLGPLHGVPVTLKEALDLAGTPSTFGVPSRRALAVHQDEIHVARLRQAGAVVLGKTNVAQLLMYYESDNPAYGRTLNPWNPERTPGGSSGGEAAIIAAGGSALGLGTDLGGSLRVPAAFSGIASIKPTAGRTPDPGRFSLAPGQQAIPSQVGPLARNVADVALALDIINGGRTPAGVRPAPLGDYSTVDLPRLRVAYYASDGTFTVAPAVGRAVREAAGMLRDRGAQVLEWTPPDAAGALELVYGIFIADGGQRFAEILGREPRTSQMANLMMLAQTPGPVLGLMGGMLRLLGQTRLADGLRAGGHHDTHHYWRLVEEQMLYRQRFQEALDSEAIDLIVSPACALPAFTHGASRELLTAGAYAVLYNLLGYPAGVVPVTTVRPDEAVGREPSRDGVEKTALKVEQGSAGLPIGVQVAARPWREHVALAAMSAIESAARQRPGFPWTPVA